MHLSSIVIFLSAAKVLKFYTLSLERKSTSSLEIPLTCLAVILTLCMSPYRVMNLVSFMHCLHVEDAELIISTAP